MYVRRKCAWGMWVAAGWAALAGTGARGATIQVLNESFESPVVNTAFLPVSLSADNWMLNGPGPYVDVGAGPQNSGTGIFPNPSPGSPGRFDNAAGNQLAYIFTTTGNEFLQTLSTTFQAVAGSNVYRLTTGVGNAGSAPARTDQLLLSLFYTNPGDSPTDPTKRQFVAQTIVKNDPTTGNGLSGTHLNDFSAFSAPLAAGNAALGRPINVLISTVGAGGAEFDFDNVRLDSVPEPASLAASALGALGLLTRRRARRPGQH